MKMSACRPPILLDESMCAGRHVRDTVAMMRKSRKRVLEATGFVPTKDLSGIERIVVESGIDGPSIDGPELIVPPDVAAGDLLRMFGSRVYDGLSGSESKQWSSLFQRDLNSGKRVMLAAEPSEKFAEMYTIFHMQPKKLRDESMPAYSFFEKLYGKHMDQMWGV